MSKQYKITVNGKSYDVVVEEVDEVVSLPKEQSKAPVAVKPATVDSKVVQDTKEVKELKEVKREETQKPASGDYTEIKAQIPGTVVDYKVAVGDSVSEGQVLLILEAMKMENEIISPVSGVVKAILADRGSSVVDGQVLLQIG